MKFDYHPESVPALQASILAAFEAGVERVVIGLDGLERLESGDVRSLIVLLRRAREVGGELALAVSRPEILRPLKVMALDRLFPLITTRAAA
ncbi:MAG: STAS domain-containing protein [Candidatus Eremiobacteraeota bacterium]|nr:STAS domain-containing protein [Candidatus Eremiobacteraeota bacterium]